jgi:hypothetical protein
VTAEADLGGDFAAAGAIRLEWATYGKRSGQRDDYTVLETSGLRLKPTQFDRIIRQFSPGTPAGPNPGQPDSLPWVTIASMRVGGNPYVGIAIREWPPEPVPVDAFGRTIVGTRFFCLPLPGFLAAFGTFGALYAALRDHRPEASGTEVCVPPASAPDVAGLLDRYPIAADIAARLIDRPVGLVPASYPRLEERLELIDAVAALLPAGARAAFSASTWADRRASHQLRLAFTQRAGIGPNDVDPAVPSAPAAGTAGSRYARNLEVLRQLTGGLDGAAAVLATDTEAQSFGQPESLVVSVARPSVERAIADADAGDLGLLVAVLRGLAPPADPDGRLLGRLLPVAGAAEAQLIADHWVPALLPALTDRCLALVTARSPDAEAIIGVAAHLGVLPDIVGRLLNAEHQAAIDAALDIVHGPGDDPGWDALRDRIAADARLTRKLLTAGIESGRPVQGLRVLVSWLNSGTSGELPTLRSYRAAITNAPRVRAHPGDLAGFDDRSLFALMTVAGRSRTSRLAEAFSAWLATEGTLLTQQEREKWIVHFDSLKADDFGFRQWPKQQREWLNRLRNQPDERYEESFSAVGLAVTWSKSGSAAAASIAGIAERYLPRGNAVAYVGDAVDSALVIGLGPARGSWWCCRARYRDLIASGQQFSAFAEAARAAQAAEPAEIILPAFAPRAVAGIIDRYGFGDVATIAARVLDGPVTVTIAGPVPGYAERLDLLAAVSALLPRGVLASLTACTGPPVYETGFRLDIGVDHEVTPHRAAVPWPGTGVLSLTGTAEIYRRRLLRLRHVVRDTVEIVETLARDEDMVDLGRLDARLSIPASEAPLFYTEPDEEVSAARRLVHNAVAGWEASVRPLAAAVRTLLTRGGVADVELVVRYLRAAAPADVAPLMRALVPAIRDERRMLSGTALLFREGGAAAADAIVADLAGDPTAVLEVMAQTVRAERPGRWVDRWVTFGRYAAFGEYDRPVPELALVDAMLQDRRRLDDPFAALGDLVRYGPDAVGMLLRIADFATREYRRDWLSALLDELDRLPPDGLGPAPEAYRRWPPAGQA